MAGHLRQVLHCQAVVLSVYFPLCEVLFSEVHQAAPVSGGAMPLPRLGLGLYLCFLLIPISRNIHGQHHRHRSDAGADEHGKHALFQDTASSGSAEDIRALITAIPSANGAQIIAPVPRACRWSQAARMLQIEGY